MTLFKKTLLAGTGILLGASLWLFAQDRPTFRIKVDMVVLSFTVTDSSSAGAACPGTPRRCGPARRAA